MEQDQVVEVTVMNSGKSAGFTLIEVLIAMTVLAVGIIAVAGFFMQGMIIVNETPKQLAVKEMALEIIDDYLLRREAGTTDFWTGDAEKTITTADNQVFSVEAAVTDVNATDPGNCAEYFSATAPGPQQEVNITVRYCQRNNLDCLNTPQQRIYRITACID